LREVPAVEILRRVWVQQFSLTEGQVRWRSDDTIPPASLLIASPSDPEAHMSSKRSTVWTGYKVHVTETGDEDLPPLLVPVETTPATMQAMEITPQIHQALADKHRLPREPVVDTGSVEGAHLLSSQQEQQIELLGPIAVASNWQMRAGTGFDVTHFQIEWPHQRAICASGKAQPKVEAGPRPLWQRTDPRRIWTPGLPGLPVSGHLYPSGEQPAPVDRTPTSDP
jgi:transposase